MLAVKSACFVLTKSATNAAIITVNPSATAAYISAWKPLAIPATCPFLFFWKIFIFYLFLRTICCFFLELIFLWYGLLLVVCWVFIRDCNV